MKNHIDDSTLDFYELITNLPLCLHVQCERSALHVACLNGHVAIVKCLLEKDASNINDKDNVRYNSSIYSCPFDYSLHPLQV